MSTIARALGRRLFLLPLALTLACDDAAPVALGPFDLDPAPQTARFETPVAAPGSRLELCFHFDRPSDSQLAHRIRAVLLTPEGGREPMDESVVDRRGESVVCLAREGLPPDPRRRYDAVELRAEEPVRVREVRWWSGE
jgi:hypothetical protein